jgi:hypothetical protein
MGNVLDFQPKILNCYACKKPMEQDDDGNYHCTKEGCSKGHIVSDTGVKISRDGTTTIIEPG